jgi:hypothetical protein
MLFLVWRDASVDEVVYASSSCVYPKFRPNEVLYLTEDTVAPSYDADNIKSFSNPSFWDRE